MKALKELRTYQDATIIAHDDIGPVELVEGGTAIYFAKRKPVDIKLSEVMALNEEDDMKLKSWYHWHDCRLFDEATSAGGTRGRSFPCGKVFEIVMFENTLSDVTVGVNNWLDLAIMPIKRKF